MIRSIVVDRISTLLDWVEDSLKRLDPAGTELAIKTCLAIVIAYGAAFLLNFSAATAAITVLMLHVRYLGASLDKSILRIVGTLAGVVIALVVMGIFAQDRFLFIVLVALLNAILFYMMQGSRYPYAWFVCAMTVMIVGFGSVESPNNTFHAAVSRASGVLLGIVSSLLVHGLLWPSRAGDDFERQLREILNYSQKLLSLKASAYLKNERYIKEIAAIEKTLITGLPKLRQTLASAAFDTGRFSRFLKSYNVLVEDIATLVSIIVALGETIKNSANFPSLKEIIVNSNELSEIFELLQNETSAIVAECDESRDGTFLPKDTGFRTKIRDNLDGFAHELKSHKLDIMDLATFSTLISKIRKLESHLIRIRSVLRSVEIPADSEFFNAPEPEIFQPENSFSMTSPRFTKAITAGLVVIIASLVWIVTNWPFGSSKFILYAWAVGYVNVVSPFVPPRPLLSGLILATAVGSIMFFIVMPQLDGFLQLAPFLMLLFFPFCYKMSNNNPLVAVWGTLVAVFLILFIDVTESQAYSFSGFVNTFIAAGGGFLIGLLTLGLFATRVPEREFRKQLASFFGTCERTIKELEEDKPWTPHGKSILISGRKELIDHVKTCGLWSNLLKYDRVPANDNDKVISLLAAIAALVFRIESMEQARQEFKDESSISLLRDKAKGLSRAVNEAFLLIKNSISEAEQVPDLPDISGLIDQIRVGLEELREQVKVEENVRELASQVLVVIGFYLALAESIGECRRCVNALDWKAWDQAYF